MNLLSRGGLTIPSSYLADFSCNSFAILDYVEHFVQNQHVINVREAFELILKKYATKFDFTCPEHHKWGRKFASKIIVNVFCNNKQKIASDSVREDAVIGFKKRQRTN